MDNLNLQYFTKYCKFKEKQSRCRPFVLFEFKEK